MRPHCTLALAALLVVEIINVVTAAPEPGYHHEHVRIHVPYKVHTVHHYHEKKIHVPVHHVEKVHVPVPVHHVEKVHVPVPYKVVEKVHVPVHIPVHHEKPHQESWDWDK